MSWVISVLVCLGVEPCDDVEAQADDDEQDADEGA